jgi:hypothetical protein
MEWKVLRGRGKRRHQAQAAIGTCEAASCCCCVVASGPSPRRRLPFLSGYDHWAMPAGRHFNDWRRRPGGGAAAALLVAARVSACVPWRGKSRSAPANSRARGSNFPRPTPAGPLAAAGRRGVTGRTQRQRERRCGLVCGG